MSNRISQSLLKLKFDQPLEKYVKVKDLRGAVAHLYPEKILLHQHLEDGRLNYSYPIIQYKILNRECLILGFNEGAELLTQLDFINKTILLGEHRYQIVSNELYFQNVVFEVSETAVKYKFITPWLALNEKNFERFINLTDKKDRKDLLQKILIGNIISIAKNLGYTVPETIDLDLLCFKEIGTSLKQVSMLGFLGTFSVNFSIPDYWGIGKSVSRGFGTVKRISDPQEQKGADGNHKEDI